LHGSERARIETTATETATMSVSAEAPTRVGRPMVPDPGAGTAARANGRPVRVRPLLAVCGLAGGAGATTVAYLVALAAAQRWNAPVLVADTGGPSGGLAACAGVEAPRSLPELASDLAAGLPPRGGLYAIGPSGVRVLASGPAFTTSSPAEEQLARLLTDAREAHALTVIDCGTLAREVDQAAAAAASHVAWLTPATARGVSYARRVLDVAPRLPGKQIMVARAEVRQPKAPVRELRRIAAERNAPLVLVPHLPELEDRNPDRALEAAQVPIEAILGALRR
jgi:MinD-like ATPase involved in chromosome partitioning or flagellar assembly